MPSNTAQSTPEHLIIIVHGTWGRGIIPSIADSVSPHQAERLNYYNKRIRWFHPRSKFCQRLSRDLEKYQIPNRLGFLEWSGSNSFRARYDAAHKLLEMIEKVRQEEPNSQIVCISHSHGGNIGLLALNLADMQGIPTKLVTLATPFINTFEREDMPKDEFGNRSVFAFELFIWFILESYSFIVTSVAMIVSAAMLMSKFYPEFDSLLWLVFIGPIFAIFSLLRYTLLPAWVDRVSPSLNFCHEIALNAGSDSSMLVIRGVDDEASLVLALGRIGVRISSRMMQFVSSIIFLPFVALLCGPLNIDLGTALLVAAASLFILHCTSLLLKATAGRELMLPGLNFDIIINSSPDVGRSFNSKRRLPEIWTKTFPTPRRWRLLRHAMYESEETSEVIARWLKYQLDREAVDKPIR